MLILPLNNEKSRFLVVQLIFKDNLLVQIQKTRSTLKKKPKIQSISSIPTIKNWQQLKNLDL